MCGGSVLPVPTALPRTLQLQTSDVKPTPDYTGVHPIVWREPLPKEVSMSLVSWVKLTGQVTNIDM